MLCILKRYCRVPLGVGLAAALSSLVLSIPAVAEPAKRPAKTAVARVSQSLAAKPASAAVRLAAHASPRASASTGSVGHRTGLQGTLDPLGLASSAAFVVDQHTGQALFGKNERAVLPIASLTKLMTGLVISRSGLSFDERITITDADVDRLKNSSSRLPVGTTLTRGQLLHLALMSSENRAAHALGRTFPGGMSRFVAQMNAHAALFGMTNTRYVEPTGLSSGNQSTARDLAILVNLAHEDLLLRRLTTSHGYEVHTGGKIIRYRNTDGLVYDPDWDVGLQKTGYIREAGRCLVLQTNIDGRDLIMVFLDSAGTHSRIADARRVRQWVQSRQSLAQWGVLRSGRRG